MFQLVKVNSIERNEYRIEGLKVPDVLQIYKALDTANRSSHSLELDVMVKCLKQDIDRINRKKGAQYMKTLIIFFIILGVSIGQAPLSTAWAKGGHSGSHSGHGHGKKHKF